jgi:hypothetical protein
MQSLVEGRTKPVHSVINCILDGLMPVFFRQLSLIINHIAHRVTVLKGSKLTLAISYSEYQIASPFGSFHTSDRLVESFIPLQHIS